MDLFPKEPETLSPREQWRRAFIKARNVQEHKASKRLTMRYSAWIGNICELDLEGRYYAQSQTRDGALDALAIKLEHPLFKPTPI